MAEAAELFTACRSCGQQVSTYSTECPYCGNRLRRRSPRLERKDGDLEALLRDVGNVEDLGPGGAGDESLEEQKPKRPRFGLAGKPGGRKDKPAKKPKAFKGGGASFGPGPSRSKGATAAPKRKKAPKRTGGASRARQRLAALGSGEQKPWATIVLVTLSLFGLTVTAIVDRGSLLFDSLSGASIWQYPVSALVYFNSWHQLAVVATFGVFAWLWERRAGAVGSLAVVVAFLAGGIGGIAAAVAANPGEYEVGAGGAATAMVGAWIVAELIARRRRESVDGDLLGATTMLVVVLIVCSVAPSGAPVAALVGLPVGLLLGLGLSALRR